jgi:hypothetical protein
VQCVCKQTHLLQYRCSALFAVFVTVAGHRFSFSIWVTGCYKRTVSSVPRLNGESRTLPVVVPRVQPSARDTLASYPSFDEDTCFCGLNHIGRIPVRCFSRFSSDSLDIALYGLHPRIATKCGK